jgi:TetR/AcrR family acrAB operon transcriptional repressor
MQADRTKMNIMLAAEQLFCVAGFSGTSLEEIARIAGVTRGAVYWHFGSKHKIFESVCDAAAFAFEHAFSAGAECSPLEALVATAEAIFLTVAGQRDGHRHISSLLFKWGGEDGSEIIRKQRVALSARLRTYAGGRLELAVASGDLPADFSIPTAVLAYEAYMFGVLEGWLFAPDFDLPGRAHDLAVKAGGLGER